MGSCHPCQERAFTPMRVIEARSGEPIGVRRFGEAAALLCRHVPSPHFNAVVGLRGGQEGLIAEIDGWYRENNLSPRFVIAPGDLTAEMGRTLAQRGYAATDTETMAEIYAQRFSDPDGKVRATFEIIWLSGWAPHESQQKPLRPGSAQTRLADALGTKETKLP